MRRDTQGLTLVELMIVIVIVGILAAVAYPNYREHVTRSKRTEAKAALLQIATNQERYYLNHNEYTTDLTKLGFRVDENHVTDSGAYTINVVEASAANFRAVAEYREGGVEAGRCQTFTLQATGERTSAPEPDCWTRTR